MPIEKKLEQYKRKNIHIVGIAGAEGSAIAEFLVMHGITSIIGHDFSSKEDFVNSFNNTHLSLKLEERKEALNHLLNLPIKINYKENYLKDIERADIVFVSQVWFKYPQNLPMLKNLYDKGVLFKTITNLYFELAPCKIISVTGTNGKTTTSRLINSIFEVWVKSLRISNTPLNPLSRGEFGRLYFAGNDRQNIQVLDKLDKIKKEDVLILETSSTQLLLNSGISPHIGVITNITPNHIDDHGSFENYVEAKKNLIRYQKEEDYAILNYDNEATRKIAEEIKAESGKSIKSKVFLFSRLKKLEEGCFISGDKIVARKDDKKIVLFGLEDIKLLGAHNIENVLAAASVAFLYGISSDIIKEGISRYEGTKHRLKLVYNIDGIKYYDDTQATTPEATIAGINSFGGDIILLCGGDDKGMSYGELSKVINNKIKIVMLFSGSASLKMEELIDKEKVIVEKVNNFSEALDIIKDLLNKKTIHKDSVILISPATAHFYSKFVENSGKDLKEWIRNMKRET